MKIKLFLSLLPLIIITACGGGSSSRPDPEPVPEPVIINNSAPIATKDTGEVINGGVTIIDVLGNDNDADGDPLTLTNVSASLYGNVEIVNNKVQITPTNTKQVGAESLSYTISDGNDHSVSSTIDIEYFQSVTIQGKVIALSGNNNQLSYQFENQNHSVSVSPQGDFELALKSKDDLQVIQFSATNGTHTLKGYQTSLAELVAQSNNNALLTSSDSHLVVVTPVSTVHQVLYDAFIEGEMQTEAAKRAFEQSLDADTLLESAALIKLFSKDGMALPAETNNIEAFLKNKAAIWEFSLSIVANDETISTPAASDGSLIKGVAVRSNRLKAEINNLKTEIQPYIKPRFNTEQSTVKQSKNANNQESLTYYQLRPGHENRIANYDFSGAVLTLDNNGTGFYQNETGASTFTWQDDNGMIRVSFTTPISEETYTSAWSLAYNETLPQSVVDNLESSLHFKEAYFTVSMSNLDIQMITDNEFVDIVSMTPHYSVSSATIFGDETLQIIAPSQYQELRIVDDNSSLPFTQEELVGQWAMAVIAPANYHHSDGEVSVTTNLYADLLTLNANGSGSTLLSEQTLNWNLDEQGVLTINQQNGGELSVIRLAQDGKAYGALILAELDGKAVSSYRMIIKKEISNFDMNLAPNAYWQASWGLANPQNYNSDGSLKQIGYFGFRFNGVDRAEKLLTSIIINGNTLDYRTRSQVRFLETDENDNLNFLARIDWLYNTGIYSDCGPISADCYVWRKRQWIPLAQDENRLYMLEPQYWDLPAIYQQTPLEQINLTRLPQVKTNYYELTPYPDHLVIEN